MTFILTVTNGDFSPADDAQVSVQLPAFLQFSGVSPSTTQCAGFGSTPGGNLTCSVGALARHSSAEIRITTTARESGGAFVTASAMSSSPDPLPDNNNATTPINVTVVQAPSSGGGGGGGGGGSLTWAFLLVLVGFALHRPIRPNS